MIHIHAATAIAAILVAVVSGALGAVHTRLRARRRAGGSR